MRDNNNGSTDVNLDDEDTRTGRVRPNTPDTKLGSLRILPQESDGVAIRPARWVRDEPEHWSEYQKSHGIKYENLEEEDQSQCTSFGKHMQSARLLDIDGGLRTEGITIPAEESGGSPDARELTLRFRRRLKNLKRTFRYHGELFSPIPSSRSYGGPGWFQENYEAIESMLAEGFSVDEVWACIEEAFLDPEFGQRIYNMYMVLLTQGTSNKRTLKSAEKSAHEWYNALPETIRNQQLDKLRKKSILLDKKARRTKSNEKSLQYSREARTLREQIDAIQKEKLPPLLETTAGKNFRRIEIDSKPRTYSFNEWGDETAQVEVTGFTMFYGLLPVEQKILCNEALSYLPECNRQLVKGRKLDDLTYRELKEKYGVPSSTAERRIKNDLIALRGPLDKDGMFEAS